MSITFRGSVWILIVIAGFFGPAHSDAQTPAPLQVPDVGQPTAATAGAAAAAEPEEHRQETIFHVKYISAGAVYLDAGRNAGLDEGMILHVVHADPGGGTTEAVRFQGKTPLADLRIFSVADTSSAAEILKSQGDLTVGDIAYMDMDSVHTRADKANAAESANYPAVATFTSGDPLDEEFRATNDSPHAAAETAGNQIRGRVGFDVGSLSEAGGISSRQYGFVLEANMSHIGGTHWNLNGNWRADFSTNNSGNFGGISPIALNQLLNRTYTLALTYDNPDSVITAGVGRMYLPYAPSLSTIDGGYVGYKLDQKVTVGTFAGSTPDPTSWSYAPNQRIAGLFVNYQGGDYDHLHYSDTAGIAATSIGWHIGREFVFLENTINYGRQWSFYNSLQFDKARTVVSGISYGTGLTQSFTTVTFQPIKLLAFDLNDNYLRNLPSFDPALIATGLVDQYLFQGLSGGVRINLPYKIALSTDQGHSNSSTDTGPSWNQMYSATFGQIWKTGLQLDLRYSKFNSAFGAGSYQFASLAHSVTERMRVELQAGTQHLTSAFTANANSKFISSLVDFNLGSHYFFEGLVSWNTGTIMHYTQTDFTFGYRFGGSLRK